MSERPATSVKPSRAAIWQVCRAILRYRLAAIGAGVVIFLVAISVFAPLLAPNAPEEQDLYNVLSPPSLDHWLGTNNLGQDLFSRLLYGGRVSLLIGFSATLMSATLGISIGLLAGFKGGLVDAVFMRLADAFICFPPLVFVLAMVAALGGGIQNVVLAIVLFGWTGFARIVRGQVLMVRELPFIEAIRASGAKPYRIAVHHILPNTLAPVIVTFSLSVGFNILVETTVSFLGLGVQPPTASWGLELRNGYNYLDQSPLYSIIPGLLITAAVLAFNFLGDGIRDVLDPRLRGENRK